MPDVWERSYTFDPEDTSDASEDWDMDGVSNLDEFRQGSDPRDVPPPTTLFRAIH